MKFLLASISALALMSVSAAACPFSKTAEHHTMSVASLEKADTSMSTTADAVDEEKVDEVITGAIATGDEETGE